MRCEECRLIIEEYIDGELNERETGMVSAHLAACASCSAACEEFELEQEIYAHYKRDVELTPALWSGVKARIEEEKNSRTSGTLLKMTDFFGRIAKAPSFSPSLAAAAAIAAVAVAAWVIWTHTTAPLPVRQSEKQIAEVVPKQNSNPQEEKSPTAVPPVEGPDQTASAGLENNQFETVEPTRAKYEVRTANRYGEKRSKPSAEQLVREAEQKYMAAINILARDAKDHRSQLTPDTLAQFNETLAAIDQTIAETRRAVRKDPKDPIAVQYMLAAYSKKVEVLKEIASY